MNWKVKYVYTTAPCKLYIYGDDRKRERERALRDREKETGDDREREL